LGRQGHESAELGTEVVRIDNFLARQANEDVMVSVDDEPCHLKQQGGDGVGIHKGNYWQLLLKKCTYMSPYVVENKTCLHFRLHGELGQQRWMHLPHTHGFSFSLLALDCLRVGAVGVMLHVANKDEERKCGVMSTHITSRQQCQDIGKEV
jgi:hypothetical protein